MKNELHQKIESCLNGSITVDDLEVWLVSNMQNILDTGNDEIIEMADQIDADMIVLGEGIIGLDELYDHLRRLLSQLETISVDITTPGVVEPLTETFTETGAVNLPFATIADFRQVITLRPSLEFA